MFFFSSTNWTNYIIVYALLDIVNQKVTFVNLELLELAPKVTFINSKPSPLTINQNFLSVDLLV